MKKFMSIAALLFILSAGFVGAQEDSSLPALVTTDWLAQHLSDSNLVILEVRSGTTSIQFPDGHIPGAVYASSVYFQTNYPTQTDVPYDLPTKESFEFLVRKLGINQDSTVVIVNAGLIPKDIMCATRTAWTFDYFGMSNIAVLDGGFGKWKREGRPISKEIAQVTLGDYAVTSIQPEVLADYADVRAALADKNSVLLDSRMVSDYIGTTKQDFIPIAGHIPGSINYFADFMLNADLTFKSAKQIAFEMALLSINKDKTIITLCNSGQFATTNWFALEKVAGFHNVSSYDDSVSDWVNNQKLPLSKDEAIKL
ncbi:MAG: sulfurtransferase [Spirochaetes bacterium]|nr:sulfurtransferase [Spirochaetota bacterium]